MMNNLQKALCITGIIIEMYIEILKVMLKLKNNKILMNIRIAQIASMKRTQAETILQMRIK